MFLLIIAYRSWTSLYGREMWTENFQLFRQLKQTLVADGRRLTVISIQYVSINDDLRQLLANCRRPVHNSFWLLVLYSKYRSTTVRQLVANCRRPVHNNFWLLVLYNKYRSTTVRQLVANCRRPVRDHFTSYGNQINAGVTWSSSVILQHQVLITRL